MLKTVGEPIRVCTSLLQPLMLLFVLGHGLGSLTRSVAGVPYQTFVFAGALVMPMALTSVVSATSIVWDRELGFLREMLIAPVSRTSVVLGKCLGAMTIAFAQGLIVLAFAGTAGIPYEPALMITLLGCMALIVFTFSCFGVLVAAHMGSVQSFTGVTQTVMQPLFFLSGSLFPVEHLPGWLTVLNRLDPLTYAVDPIRRAVLGAVGARSADYAVTWNGTPVPVWLELLLVLAGGLGMLWAAVRAFKRL
ncbi:ABC transporter [Streptomyces sp. WAC06614]|nr:ABC transporter [Streptomyces sp. WAC06614]